MSDDAIEKLRAALESDQEGTGVMLGTELVIYLIDCSSSMSDYMEGRITKSTAVRRALTAVFEAKIDYQNKNPDSTDEIAVILFPASPPTTKARFGDPFNNWAAGAEIVLDPTRIDSRSTSAINRIFTEGGTPMAQAFQKVQQMLEKGVSGMVRLVVVSDGVPNDREACIELAMLLAESEGAVIDTVGVGSGDSSMGYDEAFMRQLAEIGKGTFTHVSDVADLTTKLLQQEAERRSLLGKGMFLLGSGK